jgi:outer membrane immunogenic protein
VKKLAILSAAIAAFGFAAAANAADMPVKAPVYKAPAAVPYGWTGFYVGINGGYGWAPTTGTLATHTADFAPAIAAGGTPQSLQTKAAGAIGGLQAGYNWQFGRGLLGVEADIDVADISDTGTVSFAGGGGIFPSTSTGEESLKWLGTVRLRGGFLILPRALLYATGGFAYGRVKNSATNFFTPAFAGIFSGSTSATRTGWTVGGGIEWALTHQWSVRAEYLHVDLGDTTVRLLDPVSFPASSVDYNFKHRYDIVRAGVNYHF